MHTLLARYGFGITTALALAIAAGALPGCSSGDDDALPSPSGGSSGTAVPAGWYVEYPEGQPGSPPDAVVLPDDAPAVLRPGGDVVAETLDFLAANAGVFGMPDPRAVLDPIGVDVDDANETHVRFEQVAGKARVPVFGEQLLVHFDDAGAPFFVDGAHVPNLDAIADRAPAITASVATSAAVASLDGDVSPTATATGAAPTLVVWVPDVEDQDRPALAWLVAVGAQDVIVDAASGAVLHSYAQEAPLSGTGVDELGATKTFPVAKDPKSGRFYMSRVQTDDAQEIDTARVTKTHRDGSFDFSLLRSSSLDSGWDPVGVSAYTNLIVADRWFRDVVHRDVYDPSPKAAPILLAVHANCVRNDSFGGHGLVSFGDGVPTPAPGALIQVGTHPWGVALDIVAHEYTHNITYANAKRGYLYERQPGAVNEAISDVFAAIIEHSVTQNDEKSLLIGEDVTVDGSPVRDMRYPSHAAQIAAGRPHLSIEDDATTLADWQPVQKPTGCSGCDDTPCHSNDLGHVHQFATVGDLAFALMVRGGAHPVSHVSIPEPSLGFESARRVWWNTEKSGLRPRSKFAHYARSQVLFAKKAKLPVAAVACAWRSVDAIGDAFLARVHVTCPVTTPPPPPPPPDGDAGAGDDGAASGACSDKADGVYCNPFIPSVAYVCKGGQIAGSQQCASTAQTCIGPNGPGTIQCQ